MKQLIPFIKKEFYHISRDKETLLIMFIMPTILVILFGFAIRTEIKESQIAILDKSRDELSIGLINKLLSTDYFVCDAYTTTSSITDATAYVATDAEIDVLFRQGDVDLVIVIPKNFSKEFYSEKQADIQIITDASNLNSSTVLKSYAQSIIEDYRREKLNIDSDPMPFEVSMRMIYNPEMKDVYMFVPGVLALILILISALMTAISLTREKEYGTLNILTVSPLRTSHIIIGKIIPYLIIAVLNTIIILVLSVWFFDMPINGSIWTLSLVCMMFLITALSLGIFISSIAKTQQIAIFISIVALYLPTVLLSGFIYPIENMPIPLQVISHIFPAKWFIEAMKAVMIKGSSISVIWLQLAVLGATAFVMLRISIMKYSRKK